MLSGTGRERCLLLLVAGRVLEGFRGEHGFGLSLVGNCDVWVSAIAIQLVVLVVVVLRLVGLCLLQMTQRPYFR